MKRFIERILEATSGLAKATPTEATELAKSVAEETVKRYGPLEKGPLHSIAVPNSGGKHVSDYFRSASYIERLLTEDMKAYRAYGGAAGEISSWWGTVKPTGPLQQAVDAALDPSWGNSVVQWVEITIPKGTKIYEGLANSQGRILESRMEKST